MDDYKFKATPGAVDGFSVESFQKKVGKDALWGAVPAMGALGMKAGRAAARAFGAIPSKGKKKKKTDGPH